MGNEISVGVTLCERKVQNDFREGLDRLVEPGNLKSTGYTFQSYGRCPGAVKELGSRGNILLSLGYRTP